MIAHDIQCWMDDLPFDDPVQRALAHLLQQIIFIVAGFALINMGTSFVAIVPLDRFLIVLASVVLLCATLVALIYLRRGYFARALHLTLASMLILIGFVIAPAGLVASRAAFTVLALPIVLAGLLASRAVLWLTTAASVGLVIGIAVLVPPTRTLPTPITYDPVLTCVVFVLAAVTLSVIVRQSSSILHNALSSATFSTQEAVQTKQALHASDADYRLIADNTSDLIALLHSDGRYVYASPSYARALGIAPVVLIGTEARDAIYPDDRATAATAWDQVHNERNIRTSYRIRDVNGVPRWFDISLTAATRDDEHYTIMVARDITERRELEARLQQTHTLELLGRLAGSVAHDFNTLLTVINGGATLALGELSDHHPARAEVLEVKHTSQRAMNLTRQLLAFARQQVISTQLVSVADLVIGMRPLLQRLVGDTIQIVITISADVWPVRGDPGQLEQVLMNLGSNARDAMPHGGHITIRAVNMLPASEQRHPLGPSAYVALTIADTGVGMTPELQQHLFEPFFTTKAPDKGTGLGLATCYGIVTQMGGTITVASAPNEGTTFTILLPSAGAQQSV